MTPPQTPSTPPIAPGDTLPRAFGAWRLERRLATGGMAELFLAIRADGRGPHGHVALKRVLPSLLAQSEFVAMLHHEARIAKDFAHPNLVTTHAVGEVDGEPYIVLEYLHGEDVRTIVRSMRSRQIQQFPLAQAIAIVAGAAAGLGALHSHRDAHGHPLHIVHRDVSPQNLLVTFDGGVKVVDFGIAKTTRHAPDETAAMRDTRSLPSIENLTDDTRDDRTRTGKLKGKIPYMSPEQARGESLDGRSDIFSLGVILFELCTGRRLFRHADPNDTIRVITSGQYPKPSETDPRVWPDLEAVIERALAPDRSHRYADASTLCADLAAVARAHDLDVSDEALGAWMHTLFDATQTSVPPPPMPANSAIHTSTPDDDAPFVRRVRDEDHDHDHVEVFVPKRNDLPIALLVAFLVGGIGLVWHPAWNVPTPASPALAEPPAMIEVHSEPEGARVDIDGIFHNNHTPDLLTGLAGAPGTPVILTVSASGYVPKPVEVPRPRSGERTVVHVVLDAIDPSLLSTLEVTTVPPGAHVFLDETSLSSPTPMNIDTVQAGVAHTVRVVYPDMHDEMYTFTPSAGHTEHYAVTLRPM